MYLFLTSKATRQCDAEESENDLFHFNQQLRGSVH